MAEDIIYEIELVTPLFMGGADTSEGAEFRTASLKGLLRFWFRAIYPNDFSTEQEIFGAMGRRSAVSLTVMSARPHMGQARSPELRDLSYLGYGLMEYDRTSRQFLTNRPFLRPGSRFTLALAFSCHLPPHHQEKVLRAFWALAMLGGLGARSRRGFGGFSVRSGTPPEGFTFNFPNQTTYLDNLREFIAGIVKVAGQPEYSCFSTQSRVVVGPPLADGMSVLRGFNSLFQGYRSYYEKFPSHPKTRGIPRADHDLMQRFLTDPAFTPPAAPTRAAFGLPHNYYFRSSQKKGFVDFLERGNAKGRRASPVFFHVQKLATGQACGVVTFLPARFLPPEQRLTLATEDGRTTTVSPPGYRAIDDFLRQLIAKGAQRVM